MTTESITAIGSLRAARGVRRVTTALAAEAARASREAHGRAIGDWLCEVDRLTRDLAWRPFSRAERDALARAAALADEAAYAAATAYLALPPWERDPDGTALADAQQRADEARGALADVDRLARLVDGIAYVALAMGAGPRPEAQL